jgi:hypothetical protein
MPSPFQAVGRDLQSSNNKFVFFKIHFLLKINLFQSMVGYGALCGVKRWWGMGAKRVRRERVNKQQRKFVLEPDCQLTLEFFIRLELCIVSPSD